MFDLLYFTTEVAVRGVVWRYGCVDGLVCFGCWLGFLFCRLCCGGLV